MALCTVYKHISYRHGHCNWKRLWPPFSELLTRMSNLESLLSLNPRPTLPPPRKYYICVAFEKERESLEDFHTWYVAQTSLSVTGVIKILCIAYARDLFHATYHGMKIFQAFSLLNFAHGSKVTHIDLRGGGSRPGTEAIICLCCRRLPGPV